MQEMPSSSAGQPVAATRAASSPSSAGVSACTEAITGNRSSAKDVRTASQCSTDLLEYVVLFSMPEGNRKIRSSRSWGGLGWIVLVTTAPAPVARSLRMLRSWSVSSPEPTTTGFLRVIPNMRTASDN